MVADVVRHYVKAPHGNRITNGALIAAGIIAAVTLTAATAEGTTEERRDAAVEDAVGNCQVRDRTETFPAGGGHPSKDSYEPGEATQVQDLGYVIGDSWLIVRYPTSLPADQLTQLREFVTGKEGGRVGAYAVSDQQEPLKVINVRTTMTCIDFDLPALKTYTKAWFQNPRSRPPE